MTSPFAWPTACCRVALRNFTAPGGRAQLQDLQLLAGVRRGDTSAMTHYGQFCPIAQAAEVLTERWTPLVIRELALTGSRRFNDIQRGVPLMSSSLLSKRLRQLERAGIIERRQRSVGKGSQYHLTPAGEELGPVFAQLGVWSERWLRRPIFEETPDTGLLMWWIRTTVRTDSLPAGRTVIHFRFRR